MGSVPEQVNIHAAKTHFSRLVERAEYGEEIVIARAGKPVAKLVAHREAESRRKFGALRNQIEIHGDFDDPLPEEIQVACEGRGP